ncbi:MAG TPA: hypothetical protein VFY89_10710 [Ktedonobacterales bacterium]
MPASSAGTIRIESPTSSSGPVDTLLWIEINLFPSPPASYILKATTTAPSQGGCSQAQPMPGVDPITVAEAGAHISFHWPAALGRGQYWLCAFPASGEGPVAFSPPQLPPFTVLTDAAPTITITPPKGAVAGGTITATLTNWRTSDDANSPIPTALIPQGASSSTRQILVVAGTTRSDPTTGAYTLQVTLPATLQPGSYALVAQGECDVNGCAVSEPSVFFSVAASPATPTPSPTATTPPTAPPGGTHTTGTTGTPGSDAGFLWTALAVAIWGLAMVLLVATIILILKRRKSRLPAQATETRREYPVRPWR